jgi:hypothetical protein
MMHVRPTRAVSTPPSIGQSLEKVTGWPDPPPVAVGAYVSP